MPFSLVSAALKAYISGQLIKIRNEKVNRKFKWKIRISIFYLNFFSGIPAKKMINNCEVEETIQLQHLHFF